MRLPHCFSAILASSALVLLAGAQSGSFTFRNFKQHGAGQYRQESQGMRNGQPFGQPVSEVHCAAPLSAQSMAAYKQMGNMAGAMNNCSARVTVDTPTMAVAEQTCNPGALQTVITTTMRSVDDRTITEDTRMTTGGQPGMESHTKLTYLGACTAEQNAAAAAAANSPMPAMPKPSKAECAEMKQQAQGASAMSCTEMPAEYRGRCEAARVQMQQGVKQMEAMCK